MLLQNIVRRHRRLSRMLATPQLALHLFNNGPLRAIDSRIGMVKYAYLMSFVRP